MMMNKTSFSKRFAYLTTKLSHFWNRWRKEYLCDLRETHNSSGRETAMIHEGDIVIIADDKVKRNVWKMGRVESLITGRDGMVRGATLRVICKGKPEFLNRPLQKLYPLEVTNEKKEGLGCMEKSKEEKVVRTDGEESGRNELVRRIPRVAAFDARALTRAMLDSE